VVSGLKAGPNIQPAPLSCVFSGTPVLLFGEGEEIELTWEGGRLGFPVAVHDLNAGETLWLLQGSRLITDWEGRYPATEALAPLEKRKESRVAARLQELSRTYGLASREMSLVAVVKRAGDRPGELPETRVVPVGMPQNTDFSAYFASPLMAAARLPPPPGMIRVGQGKRRAFTQVHGSADIEMLASVAPPSHAEPQQAEIVDATFSGPTGLLRSWLGSRKGIARAKAPASKQPPTPPKTGDDILLDLASGMDSDGGMPGQDSSSRAIATIVALMAFVSQGHTPTAGAFRSHVARLAGFLKSLKGLSSGQQQVMARVIENAEKGRAPSGDWLRLARTPGDHWKEVIQLFP